MSRATTAENYESSGGQKWIDDTTSNPEVLFRDMAVLGTWGSPYEKGRAQVYGALELLGTVTIPVFTVKMRTLRLSLSLMKMIIPATLRLASTNSSLGFKI